ncbi:hypothetical protein BJ742DRAFT_773871 [Cladochytrium replicatum]|nr:hypothetical protein BJ742DRAFT_773871 [Cladochytrium replicatum]
MSGAPKINDNSKPHGLQHAQSQSQLKASKQQSPPNQYFSRPSQTNVSPPQQPPANYFGPMTPAAILMHQAAASEPLPNQPIPQQFPSQPQPQSPPPPQQQVPPRTTTPLSWNPATQPANPPYHSPPVNAAQIVTSPGKPVSATVQYKNLPVNMQSYNSYNPPPGQSLSSSGGLPMPTGPPSSSPPTNTLGSIQPSSSYSSPVSSTAYSGVKQQGQQLAPPGPMGYQPRPGTIWSSSDPRSRSPAPPRDGPPGQRADALYGPGPNMQQQQQQQQQQQMMMYQQQEGLGGQRSDALYGATPNIQQQQQQQMMMYQQQQMQMQGGYLRNGPVNGTRRESE